MIRNGSEITWMYNAAIFRVLRVEKICILAVYKYYLSAGYGIKGK